MEKKMSKSVSGYFKTKKIKIKFFCPLSRGGLKALVDCPLKKALWEAAKKVRIFLVAGPLRGGGG